MLSREIESHLMKDVLSNERVLQMAREALVRDIVQNEELVQAEVRRAAVETFLRDEQFKREMTLFLTDVLSDTLLEFFRGAKAARLSESADSSKTDEVTAALIAWLTRDVLSDDSLQTQASHSLYATVVSALTPTFLAKRRSAADGGEGGETEAMVLEGQVAPDFTDDLRREEYVLGTVATEN